MSTEYVTEKKPYYSTRNIVGLILGPLLFALAFFLIPEETLTYEARIVLAVTLLVATFWITESVPMAAASLIPLVLIPAFNGAPINTVASAYASPVIFMYGGGFVIAIAIEKWDLHRRIALNIIKMIGTRSNRMVLGIIISTALISLFVSNAATALMMLPVVLALINEVKNKKILEGSNFENFSKSLLLAVAYAATIGGLGTLVAAVPNALLAGMAEEMLGRTVTFTQWLIFAGPIALIMLVFLYFYLTKVQFKIDASKESKNVSFIDEELKKLGKFNRNEMMVSIVFFITVFLWVFAPFIPIDFFQNLHNGSISMFGAILLFFLPSTKQGERILEWEDLKSLPWGVLMLFGGGMALAATFESSGLSVAIGNILGLLEGYSFFIVILLLVVLILGLTEILSNTAVANLMMPLTVGLGIAIGIDPLILLAAAALAAGSCYMLPVATPPNTAVFSAGYLRVADMARAGVWLNLVSVIVITLACYYWLPIVFGL